MISTWERKKTRFALSSTHATTPIFIWNLDHKIWIINSFPTHSTHATLAAVIKFLLFTKPCNVHMHCCLKGHKTEHVGYSWCLHLAGMYSLINIILQTHIQAVINCGMNLVCMKNLVVIKLGIQLFDDCKEESGRHENVCHSSLKQVDVI